jgi:hypothetical protein
LFANRSLKDGGHVIYETHNFEVRPDDNLIHQQAISFGQEHTEMPYGAKGVHPDYQHPDTAPDGFGAQLHSYAFLRSLSHLAGFTFVENTLEDPRQALTHLRNPNLDDSPTWEAQPGIYRTFYTLTKTGKPHPILEHILKYYFQAFESRALLGDQPIGRVETAMSEQIPGFVL